MPESPAQLSEGSITWNFKPSLLMPGDYDLTLQCKFDDGSGENVTRKLSITPARRPWRNLQIAAWNETSPEFADAGITIGGSMELNMAGIDTNTRNGLYSEFNWVFLGEGRSEVPADWATDHKGKRTHPSILSPHVRQTVVNEAAAMAERLNYIPSLKKLIINTERHAGSTAFDYSPEVVALVKDKYGIDLMLWVNSDLHEWARFRPLGWLGTQVLPGAAAKDGIIRDDDPLYALHRWWHGPEGGSDVIVNDLMAEGVNRLHPEVITAKEPIARRPALRTHTKINTAQDWTYYPDLSAIVYCSETDSALARYQDHMVGSTMPQFLFKTGMAAPFDGMPTVDMFREAVWLVCSRPARLITFWNVGNAFKKGSQQTDAEIRALIGDETDAKTIQDKKLGIKAWDPGLLDEFKSLSETLWQPYGALLPKWRNTPRRVAVAYSFASHIYGNQRWPNGGWLMNALTVSGVPYDILFDNDLEMADFPMQYDVIVLPEIFALTESMAANLKKAQAAGCKLVADEQCKLKIDGIITLKKPESKPQVSVNEMELLKQYGGKTDSPAYVEAMEQLAREQHGSGSAELNALLRGTSRSMVVCHTEQVYWNLLEAGGVSYLVAVNDRRIPGELYGRFGKVREKGVAQQAEFELKGNWTQAWDLTARKPLKMSKRIKIDLPPGGGRIIMLGSKPLGKLEIASSATPVKGQDFVVDVRMKSEGLIPVELTVLKPDGGKDSTSHYDVLTNGALSWPVPVAQNAPAGTWTLQVRELASGQQQIYKFTLK